MADLNEFFEIAGGILRQIELTYAEYNVGLPSRRYITVGGQGETVHDCEQVTVSFEQAYSGLPGDQSQTPAVCNGPRSAVFVVEVVRCIPSADSASAAQSRYGSTSSVQNLSPETMNQMAKTQMNDAMLMLEAGLIAGENAITGALVDVSSGPASGGFQAMVMQVVSSAVSSMEVFGG